MTSHDTFADGGVLETVMDNPSVNALPIVDTRRVAKICTGVDIKEKQAMTGNEGILTVNQACFETFRVIYECMVPVICVVNDFCLGTGVGLAGQLLA